MPSERVEGLNGLLLRVFKHDLATHYFWLGGGLGVPRPRRNANAS